jgi:hypothetical protein
MGSPANVVLFAVLILTCAWIGRAFALALRIGTVTVEFGTLFGLLVLHTWMLWTTQLGFGWSRGVLFAPLALAAGLAHWWNFSSERVTSGRRRARRQSDLRRRSPFSLHFVTNVVVVMIVALFSYESLASKLVHADFVYHWGVKGERFFLNSGIDWSYLARPETGIFHPDYPLLLPDLYAALAVVTGGFDERVQQLWSAGFLAALALVCCRWFRTLGGVGWAVDAAIVTVTAVTASFGLAYFQSGGPDLPFAVLFLIATVELLDLTTSEEQDSQGRSDSRPWPAALRLGVLAALLASCKLEGLFAALALITLAGACLLLRGIRHAGPRLSLVSRARILAGLLTPLLLSVVPWWLAVSRYGLFQSASNSAGVRFENIGPTLRTMFQVLRMQEWQGLCLVVLFVPLLFLVARLRWAIGFVALQLAFYGYAYLTSPHEPVFFVQSNFPRLLYHVVPAVFVLLLVFLVSKTGETRIERDANGSLVP